MALTKAAIKSASHAKQYYDRHLSTIEYYGKTLGTWQGRGAALIGLDKTVTKEAFARVVDNLHPVTGQRLTPRTNGTRIERGWELDEATRTWKRAEREVENRRVGWDFTFSMPKSASVYYALTKDQEVMKAFLDTNAEMVRWIMADLKVRVRVNGADHDRESGIGLCATFLHDTARPVSGEMDPHVHAHNVISNHAYDPVEGRWKAAQFAQVLSNEWRYRAKAESLFAEKLLALGHGIRKTAVGIDMQVISPEEVRHFSKRTLQLEEVERRLRPELERRADAVVHAAAARGEMLSPEEAYQAERAKLAKEHRQSKARARLEGKELEDDWRDQLAQGRLAQITREASRSLACSGLVDPEASKEHALKHVFENKSVAKESELIIELLKTGIGKVTGEEAERFVKDDPRLERSLAQPGKVTTREVYQEDLAILETVQAGLGKHEALGLEKPWQIRDQKILGDAGQLTAVRHLLASRDGVTAVAGLPGTGKTTMIVETTGALKALTGSAPVMLAVTASAVGTLREKGLEANTFVHFRVNRSFQERVAGRTLWVDEASLVSNQDFCWLLGFARDQGCRLIVSGDPQQHETVQRGQPFKLLIDREVLQPVWLSEIYRQRNAPELKAIVEDLHALDHESAFPRMRDLGVYREFDGRETVIAQLVEDVIAEKKLGKDPLVIAPVHRDGEAFAAALEERLRQEGMLGEGTRQITRLNPLSLTEAQRQDWVNYQPGQVVEFHRPCTGGMKSGQQWTVVKSDEKGVTIAYNARQRQLPLDEAAGFNVYERRSMEVSVGGYLLVTKNSRHAKNGEVRRVQAFEGDKIVLENGRKLDASKALHVRQGHAITSQVSQSKQREKMFALALESGLPQINATQALVSVSRAQIEARVYTDSVELFENAVRLETGHKEAALDLLHPLEADQGITQAPDLQEHAIKREVVNDLNPFEGQEPELDPQQRRQGHGRGMSIGL